MTTNRKQNKYVVGFDRDGQVVYGYPGSGLTSPVVSFVRPLTLYSAKRELKSMKGLRNSSEACIYELVPILRGEK